MSILNDGVEFLLGRLGNLSDNLGGVKRIEYGDGRGSLRGYPLTVDIVFVDLGEGAFSLAKHDYKFEIIKY